MTPNKKDQEKKIFDAVTNYDEEVLTKIKTHFTPVANQVIVQPTVIREVGSIMLTQPKVSPVVTILATGPECVVSKQGYKAYLNFPTIGSAAMYEFEVDGRRFLSLMETQLICVYPDTIETKEELGLDNPQLKQDDGLAFTNKTIKTDLILPN